MPTRALRLVSDDTVEVLIAAIDRAITPPIELTPNFDVVTPLIRGTIEERESWALPNLTLIRYAEGGAAILLHLPEHVLTPHVRAKMYDWMVAVDEAAARPIALPD